MLPGELADRCSTADLTRQSLLFRHLAPSAPKLYVADHIHTIQV